jgi:hypothetical protein
VNSHNIKPDRAANDDSIQSDTGADSVRVVQLDLIDVSDLAVADDVNPGGDPYNSTGQHVIIKPKMNLED